MSGTRQKDCYYYEKYETGTPAAAFSTKTLARTRLLRFFEATNDIRKGKVLEVGCGIGGFIQAVKSVRGEFDCYDCDLSNSYIGVAKQKSKGKIVYMVCDAGNLPYDSESFDVVVVIDVLEHVENVANVLNEIFRVLKPGGLFHTYVPCEGNWYTPYFWLGANRLTKKHVGHIQKLSTKILFNMLKNAGFKVIRKRYSEHYFGQLLTYFSLYVPRAALLFFLGKETMDSCLDMQAVIKNINEPKATDIFFKIKRLWVAINRPLAAIAFYESEILKKCPFAVGVSVTCIKHSDRDRSEND